MSDYLILVFIVVFIILFYGFLLIALIYVIITQIQKRDQEDFEQRDN